MIYKMLKTLRQISLQPFSIIILLCFLQALIAFLTTYCGLTFDESIWHYIGRNWFRHGLIPYHGGVDNKSPLIFIIYGFSDLLFGVNFWFPRLLAIAVQAVGIFFVYKIANHIAGKQAGIIAIILYGLSLTWQSTDGKFVSQTQVYEITLLLVAFYYYLSAKENKYFFYTGIMAGLAFGFKFTAAFPCVVIFFGLMDKRNLSAALIFLSGILTAAALLAILLLLVGINLHDFITYSFLENFSSGSVTDHSFGWKFEQFYNQFFYSGMIMFYPFVIAWLFIKKRVDFLMLWLIASFIGICIIGMFARSHLKELLPQLSIISALSINYLLNKYSISFKPVIIILIFLFFPKAIEPVLALKKLFGLKNDQTKIFSEDDLKKNLGLWIKSNTTEDEKIYIAGYSAQAQVYSERLSPSIYFNATQTPLGKKKLFSDLLTNKPGMIAVPSSPNYKVLINQDIRQFIDSVVEKNYRLDTCLYGYNIYREK
jgi:hypothetical protein